MMSLTGTVLVAYWLMKSEPDAYGIDDLRREGTTLWDGIRNYQARNFMRTMAAGDWPSSITPIASRLESWG